MAYHVFIVRRVAIVLCMALTVFVIPRRTQALFHAAVIDEVMTSFDDDPTVQFVQIRMLAGAQNYVQHTVLAGFDSNGTYTGDIFIVPQDSSNPPLFPNLPPPELANSCDGCKWIMATSQFQTVTGLTPDFIIPAALPVSGGMICWGGPGASPDPHDPPTWDRTKFSNYVDCLAYGNYTGPSNAHVGLAAVLTPEGHSLQRAHTTNNNLNDFVCANTAMPTNNGTTSTPPSSTTMAATTPCPTDTDADNIPDSADHCTTVSSTTPPATPPDQNPATSRITLKQLDKPGLHASIAKGFFNPATTSPPIDPATNGVHVALEDLGGRLYDLDIPTGAKGSSPCGDPKDGWTSTMKASGQKTWKYVNHSGMVPPGCAAGSAKGVFAVIVKDLTVTKKVAWQYIVKSKNGTFSHIPAYPVRHIQFDLTLQPDSAPGTVSPVATAGECAESTFEGTPLLGTPPPPFCKGALNKSSQLKTITCKGL